MAGHGVVLAALLFACQPAAPRAMPDGGASVDAWPADTAARADTSVGEAPVDAAVADAGPEDPETGGGPGEEEVPVHERRQSKSEMLLFDPTRDHGTITYRSFRIPALARVRSTLLAFAEARQCGNEDFGNINLVYRRSRDEGRTWGPLEEVEGGGEGTWGNPTPVVDAETGTIWLFMSHNDADVSQLGGTHPCTGRATRAVGVGDRPVFLTRSDDEGETWSRPIDMTATLQPPGTTWDAVGPGIGIQTTVDHPGRLIVPAIRRNIYSDDHGETWHYQVIPSGTSEGTVAELVDGRLLRNDRAVGSVWETAHRRWLSRGLIDASAASDVTSFERFAPHDTLLDPRVQGSSLRYTSAIHRLLFLNPASSEDRCRMRVRVSYDGGLTWPISRALHEGSAAATCDAGLGGYSSMVRTGDYHVAALAERRGARASIELHRFNLPWLLNGTPEPLP